MAMLRLSLPLQLKRGGRGSEWCVCKTKTANLNQNQNQNQLVGGLGYTYTNENANTSIDASIQRRTMSGEDATATATASASSSSEKEKEDKVVEEEKKEDVVVQYVVLRRDLIDTWPLGSVVTQGCHASVAAIWQYKDDPSTLAYCSPHAALHSMHKVTLEVKGQPQLLNLSEKLNSSGILHKLWMEQPENIPTALATKPYPKSLVSPFFRKLKLCK